MISTCYHQLYRLVPTTIPWIQRPGSTIASMHVLHRTTPTNTTTLWILLRPIPTMYTHNTCTMLCYTTLHLLPYKSAHFVLPHEYSNPINTTTGWTSNSEYNNWSLGSQVYDMLFTCSTLHVQCTFKIFWRNCRLCLVYRQGFDCMGDDDSRCSHAELIILAG